MEVLSLSNVSPDDAGAYTCWAENSAGFVFQTAWLTVIPGKIPSIHVASFFFSRLVFHCRNSSSYKSLFFSLNHKFCRKWINFNDLRSKLIQEPSSTSRNREKMSYWGSLRTNNSFFHFFKCISWDFCCWWPSVWAEKTLSSPVLFAHLHLQWTFTASSVSSSSTVTLQHVH